MPQPTNTPSELKSALKRHAAELGLDCLGIAALDDGGQTAERLMAFLSGGRHGDMDWMARNAETRGDPKRLWTDARTAIMIGQSYAPQTNPLVALADRERAVISVYAQGRDYHDVLKARLKALARAFAADAGADVKVFVDTAPLMEKPLAARAGLGWQGKHTNLVSRAHGSWLFLGAILTTAELSPDEPETDHCGSCQRCLDCCPTHAFPAPYQLDARRCLAYLSIEHKGHIAREFRIPMGNRVFGCDDCLAVCPWNKFAHASRELAFSGRVETRNPPLADLLTLDDRAFRQRFAGTPIKRTGRIRIVRNALIAAGNSGTRSLLPHIFALLEDQSALVRSAAIWALRRLGTADEIATSRTALEMAEPDADVRAEWLGHVEACTS